VVGIVIDNSVGSGAEYRDWHMFSASISGAKTGVFYGPQTNAYSTSDQFLSFGEGQDYWLDENDESVYFPKGISTVVNSGKQFDLYAFYEPQYHWINLKRASANHWHEDEIGGEHPNIAYTNENTFIPGKGYMLALGNNDEYNDNLMQAKGVLNNSATTETEIKVAITATENTPLMGYNLLGNPYQSYLDFNQFAETNKYIWENGGLGYKSYVIYDEEAGGFNEYFIDGYNQSFSHGAEQTASRYINMHQGFFIVNNGTSHEVKFNNDMRATKVEDGYTGTAPSFRNEAPSYPLVNLICTDSDGKREVSVIEVERPETAGSLKLKGLMSAKGNMYIHWDNDDLSNIFIDHTPDYVPVWFDAVEDGVFTITWSTANADFGYLHLVDNMTGADIDCLTDDSYTFEAHVTDMSGRFRLVFSPLGIDEETTEQGENFAFIVGNELVVTGEGELSLIDLNGRILATEYVHGVQSHITMPKVAEGMYMLRLANANGVKVQKIVIRK